MCAPIVWNDKNEEHIAAHNVSPAEVEQVLYSHSRLKRRTRNNVMKYFGQTDSGRYLAVMTSPAHDLEGGKYIVTARDMNDGEIKQFRRRGK